MNKIGKLSSMILCLLMVTVVFSVTVPVNTDADEFVLHPGYVQGTINIPGHSIQEGYSTITASGYDYETGTAYRATSRIINGEYNLVVEGGDWLYHISYNIVLDNYIRNKITIRASITVAVDETVTIDIEPDAIVQGTISVEGESISYADITIYNPYTFNIPEPFTSYSLIYRIHDSGSFSFPVFGGNDYFVYPIVYVTDPYNLIYFYPLETSVPVGGSAVVDFGTVPGYIEGTVTLNGASISYGDLTAYSNSSVYAKTRIRSDGTFRFPAIPDVEYRVYGRIYTSVGYFNLDLKYISVYEGETTFVDWEFTVEPGSISGLVDVEGVELDHINIIGRGPYGSYKSHYLPSEGNYLLDELNPGEWRTTTDLRDFYNDPLNRYTATDWYNIPYEYVEVPEGQNVILDQIFTAGFIEGKILSETSDSLPYLYSSRALAIYDSSQSYIWSESSISEKNYNDEFDVNFYDMFVSPGDWQVRSFNLYYREIYTNYVKMWDLEVTDNLRETVTVSEGETVSDNADYETAQITARLTVATGDPLSNPQVSGRFLYNLDGVRDKNVYLFGRTTEYYVSEGLVMMTALPGTYDLTAEADVLGSRTTFGKFKITVDAGDVVVTEPNAPELEILFPPGNYETSADCVDVTGTVVDDSGVGSLTINGESVPVNQDGSFNGNVCDLVLGENIIELTATDLNENSVTVQRTVYGVANAEPVVDIGGPYTGDEGSEIIFDAGGTVDSNGDPMEYRWDFDNDGTWDTEWSIDSTATNTWYNDYSGDVAIEVSDGYITTIAATTITISNAEPSVIAGESQTVFEGATVHFSGSYNDPGTSDTHTISWDFGDGTTAEGSLTPDHAYINNGIYTVELTVTDNNGGVGTSTMTVIVNNAIPEVMAGLDLSVDEGSQVDFSGTFSDAGSADTHKAIIDWGDGSPVTTIDPATSPVLGNHVYADDGTYSVTLTVIDSDGGTGTDTIQLTVDNVAPTVSALGTETLFEGETASFTGSYTDPGVLDTHTILWDFGDGTTTSGTLTPDHVFGDSGNYVVTLYVTDDGGGVGSDTVTVTVENVAPTVETGDDQSGQEGDEVSFSGSFSDPGFLDTHTIEWDFGDGSTASGILDPQHTFGDNGIYTVTLTVTDDNGGVDTDTLTVTVDNSPPIVDAGSDQTITEGSLFSLFGSFTDAGSADTHTAVIDWGDGSPNTIVNPSTSPILEGHVYPDEGTYTVTLTVTDDDGSSGSDSLIVTVDNDSPNVNLMDGYGIDENYILVTNYYAQSYYIGISEYGMPGFPQLIDDKSYITYSAGIGDFDNDGDLDSLVGDYLGIWYYEKTGEGNNFAPAVPIDQSAYGLKWDFAEADYNSDGNLDVIMSNTGRNYFSLYLGNGDGTFSKTTITSPNYIRGMDAADFDNDGNMDFIATGYYYENGAFIGKVLIFHGNGDGTFMEPTIINTDISIGVSAGDFDNDGDVDFISGYSPLMFYPNNGDGTFGAPISIGWYARDLAESDINGDGNLDLVLTTGYYMIYLKGDGDGTFTLDSFRYLGDNYWGIAAWPEVGGLKMNEGETQEFSATFSDYGWMDTHTAIWNWGDESPPESGTLTETNEAPFASGDVTDSHIYGDNGQYTISLSVADDDGGVDVDTFKVTVLNVAPSVDVGPDQTVFEGDIVSFSGDFTDPGILDTHTIDWDLGDGNSASGTLIPTNVYLDEGSNTVALTVVDDDGGEGSDTLTVTVENAIPEITELTATLDPTPVGTDVDLSGAFTDPGVLDTHTAVIDWGDGTTSDGTVDESGGSGTVSGAHTYSIPGVYTITVDVTDNDGGVASESYQYVVVYDPTGAFITGGGHFESPEGAYIADPTITGKAGFGFVSKYHKGKTTPDGNTQFRFHGADIQFKSENYDWLVIAGSKGMFKGTGTINGMGSYKFIISAIDGDIQGEGSIDRFRIRIWEEDESGTENVIYDNNLGAAIGDNPTTNLTHGSIKIHKG